MPSASLLYSLRGQAGHLSGRSICSSDKSSARRSRPTPVSLVGLHRLGSLPPQFQPAVLCRRQQVDAVSAVQRDFIDVHSFPSLLRRILSDAHWFTDSNSIRNGRFSPILLELLQKVVCQYGSVRGRGFLGSPNDFLGATVHKRNLHSRPPYKNLGRHECGFS